MNIGLNADGSANYWQYDAFGRLQSVPGIITAQTYETDGQTKFIQYANGTTTAFTYSPTRRWVTGILTKDISGKVLSNALYTRDAAGRILTINGQRTRDDWTYTYDDLDRLLTATNAGDASLTETTGPRQASRAFVR